MKVNILGIEYQIYFDVNEDDMPEFCDGCMDQSVKVIKIAKFSYDRNSLKDLDEYRKKVLRHEIIHAFLYESGIWNNSSTAYAWGQSEEITDWIAIQSPKIFQAFQEAGCL